MRKPNPHSQSNPKRTTDSKQAAQKQGKKRADSNKHESNTQKDEPKTREDSKKEVRLSIIKAAAKAFSIDGYSGASTRQITQSAGVNLSMISYYFGGKEGLFHATIDETFAPVLELIESLKDSEPIAAMKSYIKFIVNRLRDSHFGEFAIYLVGQPNEYMIQNYSLKAFAFLSEKVECGKASGLFRKDLFTPFACLSLFSMIQTYVRYGKIAQNVLQIPKDEDYFTHVFTIFLHGILADSQQ